MLASCSSLPLLRSAPCSTLVSSRRAFSASSRRPAPQPRKDHYKTLSLPRNSSKKQIKERFYELSKKLHPDLRPNDAKAKEQYLNISEAYDTLGNDAKRATYDQTLSPSASLSSFGARTSSAHRPPSSSNTRSGRPSTWQHPSTRLPPRPKHPTPAGPSASWPLHTKKQWENSNSGGARPNFTASPGMMGGAHFNSPFSPYGSAAPPPGGDGGAGVDGAPRPSRPMQRTGPAQAPWREDVDINGWDRRTGRILDEGLYAPGSSGKRIFGVSLLVLVMIGVGVGVGASSRNHDERL